MQTSTVKRLHTEFISTANMHWNTLSAEHSVVISVDRVDSFDEHSTPLHDSSSEGTRNKRITRPHNGEIAVFPKSVTSKGLPPFFCTVLRSQPEQHRRRKRQKAEDEKKPSSAHLLV